MFTYLLTVNMSTALHYQLLVSFLAIKLNFQLCQPVLTVINVFECKSLNDTEQGKSKTNTTEKSFITVFICISYCHGSRQHSNCVHRRCHTKMFGWTKATVHINKLQKLQSLKFSVRQLCNSLYKSVMMLMMI